MSETEQTRDSSADGEECRTTSAESSNQDAPQVECPKTRKNPKPDPTRIFRVFRCLTWETWNFIKWKPARPGPEFSGWGFFLGFSGFEDHVGHPTKPTVREVRNFCCCSLSATATAAARAPGQRRTKYWNVIGQLLLKRVHFMLLLLGRLGSKTSQLASLVPTAREPS